MRKKLRTVAAVGAVVLFVLCAYYVYDALRERTTAEKLAEIIHLEDQRLLCRDLQAYITDDSVHVRRRAVLAIGRIGGPRSGQPLMGMLSDPSIDVARTAAFAIGLTGRQELAAPLTDLSLELPSAVAAEAVKSAGRLADSSMTDVAVALTQYLEHPSPDVREAACYALFYAGARRQAIELVTFIDQEPDSLVRLAALYCLARSGIDEGAPVFREYQANPDPFARILAVNGLGLTSSSEASRLLALSLNDSDNRVVAEAVAGLRQKDNGEAAQYLAGKLRNTHDEKLIIATLNALLVLDSDLGVDVAEMHLKSDLSDNLVAAAIRYLAAIRKDRTLGLIDSLLTVDPQPYLRVACARAYGEIGYENVVPRLAVLFADEDPMVRAAAFGELVELDTINLVFYVEKALADPDYVLVVSALEQIAQHRLVKYIPTMAQMIFMAGEVDVDVRRTIVDAFPRFYDSLKIDTSLIEILIYGILDPDYVVRRQAATIYREQLHEDRSVQVPPVYTRVSERKIRRAIEKYTVNPSAVLITDKGEIEMELYFDVAPITVLNFMELAEDGFYDGLTFHRVLPNFVVQGGDPRGDGQGGPSYYIRCEYSDEPYVRGTVGIATSGKDTGGSQFFITHSPQPHLEARYTVFGRVTGGMDVVDQIVRGDVIEKVIIHQES